MMQLTLQRFMAETALHVNWARCITKDSLSKMSIPRKINRDMRKFREVAKDLV